MQEFLTKCPHCTTVFKLNQSHLDAAQGSVRCGSCLEVFDATEHLIDQETAEPIPRAANGESLSGNTAREHSSPRRETAFRDRAAPTQDENQARPHPPNQTASQQPGHRAPAPQKKASSFMPDPLAEEDDVHWTQALSNDIDKIYQYLATELDLDNDPDLAKNLTNDQWGRDLLAELDEELSSATSTDSPDLPDNGEQSDTIRATAKSALKAAKAHMAQPSTPESVSKTLSANETSLLPSEGSDDSANSTTNDQTTNKDDPHQGEDVEQMTHEVSSGLPKFDDQLSDHLLSLPDAPRHSESSRKAHKTPDNNTKKPHHDAIDDVTPISDAEHIEAMDKWSAALLDDLKQSMDLAEASKAAQTSAPPDNGKPNNTKEDAEKTPNAGPQDEAKAAEKTKTAAPNETEPSSSATSETGDEDDPITPSFSDPVGLEADENATKMGEAALNENWSNKLLAELENQSNSIAENIKQALQAQKPNSLMPEDEVSLDDLALIPLREHSTDPQPTPAGKTKGGEKKGPKKAAKKHKPQESELASNNGLASKSRKKETGNPVKESAPAPEKSKKASNALPSTAKAAPAKPAKDQDEEKPKETANSLDTLTSNFEEPEMLVSPRQLPKINWPALACSLLLCVTLLGQMAFFKFDELSQDSQFRPWYAKLCTILPCELPPQENFEAIRSTQFVVRVHPTENNALLVDANIKNQASFAQPFPAIELTFSDLNGTPVARRRFTPDEYRGETLKQYDLMPPQRKIHLTFEIVDPGPTAKNYELKLFKHTPDPA